MRLPCLFPQALGHLVTGNDLAMPSDQKHEKFERLPLELQPATSSAQLKSSAMKAEFAKLIDSNGHQHPPTEAEV
jgi:hypothetical protein